MTRILLTGLMCLVSIAQAFSQGTTPKKDIDHSYKPMTLKLDEKGQKFIRIITWHQMWISHTMNNPGTTDINGKVQKSSNDFGIRRSRVLIQAQISPRFMIVSHFGINNQSFSNGGGSGTLGTGASATGQGGKRPQLYIHDAFTDYAIVPGKFHMGAGLHYWNGVSRMSSNSTLNFMTLDAPIFNWVNIDATDQFARQLGVYTKGQIGRLDYRMHLNKPFAFGINADSANSTTAVNVFTENWATGGYFNWMFFDKESNVLPYFVGSYLGTKKVLNIGAGWYTHNGATATKASPTDPVVKHNQRNTGIDVYLDMPLNKKKGTAINFYSVWYNSYFGHNYLRNIGILNQHPSTVSTAVDANTSWAGGGNLQPTIGTGNIWYSQFGYLLPRFKNGTAFMPYATFTYKKFDRIGKASGQYDLGMNYFISNHNAKITLQYSSRPVYKRVNNNPERNGSEGAFILQTHIFL
ncbi:MAG: porin [Bacteroidetes bacterium]|nr:porin [Bacteroidota bacterium]